MTKHFGILNGGTKSRNRLRLTHFGAPIGRVSKASIRGTPSEREHLTAFGEFVASEPGYRDNSLERDVEATTIHEENFRRERRRLLCSSRRDVASPDGSGRVAIGEALA